MKWFRKTRIALLIICLSTISVPNYGQRVLINENLTNPAYFKQISNNTRFDAYVCEKGFTYKVGSKLELGTPDNPENIQKDLFGDEHYGNYTYLRVNRDIILTVSKTHKGEVCVISEIFAKHFLLRKSPLEVYFICDFKSKKDGLKLVVVDKIDKAVASGEIINLGATMGKQAAIAELKSQKELLDLEVISKEEYAEIKTKLTPIIIGD